ncbi:MAG: alpha/beta fold hydrolase [Gammaproteobacteria bacterium]
MDQSGNNTIYTKPNDSHLEILSCFPPHPTTKPPLLFVHGSFISAWCWEINFMPFFARCGYPCYALSLRGHGGSHGHDRLHWHGLDDYVDDVAQVAQGMERPPILIGHSMGGLVVQKYLHRAMAESVEVPAMALLASVPPDGLLPMTWWLSMTRPWLIHDIYWVQAGLAQFGNYSEVCTALFSDTLPEATAHHYLVRTQAESQRALLEMSSWSPLPAINFEPPPTLVLGAERDALVPSFMVEATAEAYNTSAEVLPGLAHIMMLERDWKDAARPLLNWLETLE